MYLAAPTIILGQAHVGKLGLEFARSGSVTSGLCESLGVGRITQELALNTATLENSIPGSIRRDR